MPILDKTFSGVNKVIKYLILSCFHVNILYVSVALGQPPLKYLSNAFKSVCKDFKERPKMLIPGGGMLLPRMSINQNTGSIKQISQPSVTVEANASQNNLLRESSDNDADSLSEVAVREELIIQKRAVVLAAGGGGGVPPPSARGGGGIPPPPAGGGGGIPPPPTGGGGGGTPPGGAAVREEKDTSEEKTVPAIAATSPAADAVTTNPENIAIALLQKQKETIRVVTLAVNEIIILSYEFANSTIDLRLTNLRHLNNLTALAAGDEANVVPKNLWISGTMGTAKYNGESMLSGYTGRTSATTIGGDIELPSGSIIGGAYNYVLANFKYKERINKVAAHTHVISIYGQTNLSEKLILQGFISLALGNVSAKLPVQNQLVKAKFANTSYSKKLLVAYKSRVGTVLITPHIGFKCGWYNIAGYDENFERQSLSVAATNNQRASGVIGFEVIMPLKINNTIQVTPGLHMEAEKFWHNKQQKLRMQIMSGQSNNREEIFLLEEPVKYYYKIGGTINIKREPTEIMAVYDYLVSNAKYSSHQGSLKLKLSF